jgi:hypothetical protein
MTDEVVEEMLKIIKAGGTYSTAYGAAGVPKRTFMDWMARGRAYRAHLEGGGRKQARETIYLEFLEKVERAEGEAKALLVTKWNLAASKDWRAARDLLARRWPEEWMPRTGQEITGVGGGPVSVAVRGELDVKGVVDNDKQVAGVLAALIEAGVLPPEAAGGLEWVPDDDDDEEDGPAGAREPREPEPGGGVGGAEEPVLV